MRLPKKIGGSACAPDSLAAAVILFGAVLAGVILFAVLPKRGFSENENRVLEPAPSVSAETVLDGSFMKSAEAYVVDHFPFRDPFVALNTAEQLALGARDLGADYGADPVRGGVYFGKDDHLYEVLLPDRSGVFRANAGALAAFAEKSGVPLTVLPVPSGAQEQPENLPPFAPSHDQREEFEALKRTLGPGARVVDLFDALSLKTGADYYFRTDHHWTAYGAYAGYAALAEAMGIPPAPRDRFRYLPVRKPFYGTLYSKAVAPFQQPDILLLPYSASLSGVTQQTGRTIHTGIYWEEYFGRKDKYSVYLGGNPAATVVRNPKAAGGRLLLLKDSYANSMVPYLAENFSEIHLIDLRYYNRDIYDYIKQNGIDRAAAVYSIKQLCEVSFANKLRR